MTEAVLFSAHSKKHKFHISSQIFCLKVGVYPSCRQTESNLSVVLQRSSKGFCGIMLLDNLAEPKIAFVNCSKSHARDIFCNSQRATFNGSDLNTKISLTSCDKLSFTNNTLCFLPSWKSVEFVRKQFKERKSLLEFNSTIFFQNIFDAVDALSFPPIISHNFSRKIYFVRFLNIYTYRIFLVSNKTSNALTVDVLPIKTLRPGGNIFLCKNRFYISLIHMCNGINECPEANDEEKCVFGKKNMCPTLLYMTPNSTCKLFMYLKSFKPEEVSMPQEYCTDQGMLGCIQNKVCYNLTQVCIYKLNDNGSLFPCHFGEHLQLCRKHQCNMMFKCPGYYCIGWGYTCNGRWDCPFGFDESYHHCTDRRRCTNLFKCKDAELCIHLRDVCDSVMNCPQADDELLCMLNQYECPHLCECLGLAIQCLNIRLPRTLVEEQNPHYLLEIKNCSGQVQRNNFWIIFHKLYVISIINSGLSVGCSFFSESKQLVALNFSVNSIRTLTESCFAETIHLQMVVMGDNLITDINRGTFYPLQYLAILDLSNNFFLHLATLNDLGLGKITLFSLKNVSLSSLSKTDFLGIKLKILDTMDHHHCCLVPSNVHCTQEKPWYFACESLLPTFHLKITFYLISDTILLANIVSLILQKVSYEGKGAFEYIVAFINVADLLYSTTLFTIWIADLVFDDDFALFEISWRSGPGCFFNFGVSVLFTFLYPILLCFLSYARLQVVENPVKTHFKREAFVLKCLFGIVGGFAVISVGITVVAWMLTKDKGLPLFLCSPFVDPTNHFKIIEILTWSASVTTTACSVFILIIYVKLITELKASQQKVAGAKSETTPNRSLVVQVVIVTSSNLFCWVPTSVIYLTASFLERYPTSLLIWTSVAITPINSIINPLVFTSTTLRKIKRK